MRYKKIKILLFGTLTVFFIIICLLTGFFYILNKLSGNMETDVYQYYPQGDILKKEKLKNMKGFYLSNNREFVMKVELGTGEKRFPYLIFYDNRLTALSVSRCPTYIDSLSNNTFYGKYPTEEQKKQQQWRNNDLPAHYATSYYTTDKVFGNCLSLLLDSVTLENLPLISFFVQVIYPKDFSIINPVTISCDRLSFSLHSDFPSQDGCIGEIKFIDEKYFPYTNPSWTEITIYNQSVVDKFYDDLWEKLQKMKNNHR